MLKKCNKKRNGFCEFVTADSKNITIENNHNFKMIECLGQHTFLWKVFDLCDILDYT